MMGMNREYPAYTKLNLPLQELAENALWHEGSFYWCNITGGEIWKWRPHETGGGSEAPVMIFKADTMVGAFCFDSGGRLILLSERGLELYRESGTSELIRPVNFSNKGRFNDCITDREGRILAGTLFPDLEGGELLSFSPDGRGGYGEPDVLLADLNISNGMAFSADQTILYHTDTGQGAVRAFDYNTHNGEIGSLRHILPVSPEDGGPDGMIMDDDGLLWSALWGGSAILVMSADGRVVRKISCPARQPTCLALAPADKNRQRLFITTAAYGAGDVSRGLSADGEFLGGTIYTALI